MSKNLLDRDLVAIARAIHDGEVSSVDCVTAALDRAEQLQPQLNAFIAIDRTRALEAASAADARRAAGRSLGALHGVPLAHKDLLHRAGRTCTGGSKILRDVVNQETATVLARLDAAGAVEIGSLHMSEFAAGGTGHNEHYGDCHNPWDLSRATGGSSSGSGAAVASRTVYAALGSDTGGSVRLPAALCGISGLKPTDGRVSRHGVMPRSWSTDTLGPLARSARDLARIMSVIAGHDPRDPTTRQVAVPDYEEALATCPTGIRVGLAVGDYMNPVEPAVSDALDDVVKVLADIGLQTRKITMPDLRHAFDLGEVIVKSEAASLHERWIRERPQDYSVAVLSVIEGGLFIPAARYLQAVRLRGPLLENFQKNVFADVDVVLTPVVPGVAPTLEDSDPNSPERASRSMAEFPRFTRPISYLGLPALVLNCGFTTAGLPISCQLVGAPFSEALLLQLGHHYQAQTRWHLESPET